MLHPRHDYNARIQDNLGLIPEDEPVLLLRGQDELAIKACEYYAQLCREHQAPEVAERIENHVKLMQTWPKKKIPDLPAEEMEKSQPTTVGITEPTSPFDQLTFIPEDPENPTRNERYLMLREMALKSGMDEQEMAQFIANLGHETNNFRVVKENLRYSGPRLYEIFKGRNGICSETIADEICSKGPEAIAEAVYGGDWGAERLGNKFEGDGAKYIGRGYIQLTGRYNYDKYGKRIGVDLINRPELACDPIIASRIALDFWYESGASECAKAGDYRGARKKINGGTLGYDDIQERAKKILADTWVLGA